MVFIIFLGFLPFLFVFSHANLGKITLKSREKLHEYRYNVFLRFWIETYLSFGVFAFINYESVRNN